MAPDLLRCARRRQAEASGGVAATPRLEAALGVQPVRDGDLLGARGLVGPRREVVTVDAQPGACLLYTSDAAEQRSSVDLGGSRIIKKKKKGQSVKQSTPLQVI